MDLLDAVIDRSADILERVGAEIDQVSHDIFEPDGAAEPLAVLQRHPQDDRQQGRPHLEGAREPGLDRPPRAVSRQRGRRAEMGEGHARAAQVDAARRRLAVRPRHLSHQQDQFLLDAMLGMVSLEQNNIIKIFSVAAVVFMPPTLIASIYGMNFKHMPELDWEFGYPIAFVVMVIAAVLPYFFFKWKKWL